MPDYRFGISLLSKERFNEAYNEEVMIDKFTGEVLIKSKDGDVVSYNYNSRLKSQLSAIKLTANNMSVYGDIVSIEMDDVVAPFTMEYEKNYISTPIVLPYHNCKKILFNADIDPITISNIGLSHDMNNMLVELSLSLLYNDNSTTAPVTISSHLNEFNSKVLTLNDNSIFNLAPLKQVSGIRINSFIIKNIVMDYNGQITAHTHTIRPIFNSLFAVIEV